MPAERTGSIETFSVTAQSGTLSITVPADATLLVVGLIGAANSANNVFSGATLSVDGDNLSLVHEADNSVATIIGATFQLVNPSTGSQTLSYAFGSSDLYTGIGARVYVGYYKNVDTGAPVKASGGQQMTTTSATTGSMTAASGDAIFAVAGVYRSTLPTVGWTNATELNETTQGTTPTIRVAVAEAFPSGNTTVTAAHSGGSGSDTQSVISGFVIAAGGVVHEVSADGMNAAASVDLVAADQVHEVVLLETAVSSQVDTTAPTQVHMLAADGMSATSVMDAAGVSKGTAVSVEGMAVATAVDEATVSQAHQLSAEETAVSSSMDSVDAAEAATITAAEMATETAVDTTAVAQLHSISAEGATAAVVMDEASVSEVPAGALTADEMTLATAVAEATVSQVHDLSAEETAVSISMDNATVVGVGVVAADGMVLETAVSSTAVVQVHIISAEGMSVATVMDVADVVEVEAPAELTADEMVLETAVDETAVVQLYVVGVAGMVAASTADGAAANQVHMVAADGMMLAVMMDTTGTAETDLVVTHLDYIAGPRQFDFALQPRSFAYTAQLRQFDFALQPRAFTYRAPQRQFDYEVIDE